MITAMINFALMSFNIWAYLEWGSPLNLAVASFCGAMGVACLVMDR